MRIAHFGTHLHIGATMFPDTESSCVRRGALVPMLCFSLIGCGSESVDSICGTSQTEVSFQLHGDPAMLAYRDGDSEWKNPISLDEGEYAMCITDRYVLAVVCVNSGSFEASEYAATSRDNGIGIVQPCGPLGPAPITPFLSGDVSEPARALIDGAAVAGYSTPWSFKLPVSPGTHTLVVSNDYDAPVGAGRLVIRRGQHVVASSQVPQVDLVREGVAPLIVPVSLSGKMSTDEVVSQVLVSLDGDSEVQISEIAASEAHVIPDSQLAQADRQIVQIDASSSLSDGTTINRAIRSVFDGTLPILELLPSMSGYVSFADSPLSGATWTSLPIDMFDVIHFRMRGEIGSQDISVTRDWLESQQAIALDFDTSAPEYDPSWMINTMVARSLTIVSGNRTSAISQRR